MIEFKNVTKSFNDDVILKNISFTITRGETKIILGASGSGKSTILRLILGLIRPDSGEILVDGQDITKMRGTRPRAGASQDRNGLSRRRALRFPVGSGKCRIPAL